VRQGGVIFKEKGLRKRMRMRRRRWRRWRRMHSHLPTHHQRRFRQGPTVVKTQQTATVGRGIASFNSSR